MSSDDRVLWPTRLLSALIAPVLLVAAVLLCGFPRAAPRLFAWAIRPAMTCSVLGSAYLGGCYFFVRAAIARRWTPIAGGFPPVALFASLLAVVTIVHWPIFRHGSPSFVLWSSLYFTTPVLVLAAWLLNRRRARPAAHDEPRLGRVARWTVAGVGLLAAIQGAVLLVHPQLMISLWPWAITPLGGRVVGAVFLLGSAGLLALADPRLARFPLLLEVASLMVASMLTGAALHATEFNPSRPLTWLLLIGFVAVLVASITLRLRMRRPGLRPA